MSFSKRLQLFLTGFFISLIFLMMIFGKKMFSWSYLPNDRVLAEIKTKNIVFSPASLQTIKDNKKNNSYLLDTVLVKGKINFSESHAQASPCPDYVINYENVIVKFTKCKETTTIDSVLFN